MGRNLIHTVYVSALSRIGTPAGMQTKRTSATLLEDYKLRNYLLKKQLLLQAQAFQR